MDSSFSLSRLLLLAGVLLLAASCRDPQTQERPNIIVLLLDDHRADAVGAYGNPSVRTPTIDGLAQRGFNFREAHIMGSHHGAVCAPSRAMLLSGRQLFRVYDNLDSVATFPEILRGEGYVTFGTGKWHQSQRSFERSFVSGRSVFFGGMSDHTRVPVQDLLPDRSFSSAIIQGFSTDLFADAAIAFIETRAAGDNPEPFLAYVSFTAPHDPRTPPLQYALAYAEEDIPLPPNFLPVHPFDNGAMTLRDEKLAAWPRDSATVREQIREYYGLISHVDARIGDILAAIARNGYSDDTIVILASDNGLALGSHGLLGKQNLYEHSTRVPLIIAGKGIPQGSNRSFVLLHDLFPTVLSLAGVDSTGDIDGLDLSPIWNGQKLRVRSELYTVYSDIQRSIRDDRWKLIMYPYLDRVQLFDLLSDRFEKHDLAGNQSYLNQRQRMSILLRRAHLVTGDPHPLEVDTTWVHEFDYARIDRSPDRHQPATILEKYFKP